MLSLRRNGGTFCHDPVIIRPALFWVTGRRVPILKMPAFDVNKMLQEDEINLKEKGVKKALEEGIERALIHYSKDHLRYLLNFAKEYNIKLDLQKQRFKTALEEAIKKKEKLKQEGAILAQNYSRFVNSAREEELARLLTEKGMVINDVSAEEKARMRDASQAKVVEAIKKNTDPAFVDEWLKAIEKAGEDIKAGL